MAVLTARKLTAVAEAKLDAIEQSILEERLTQTNALKLGYRNSNRM